LKIDKSYRKKSGIYCLKNIINNKVYIGKAKDLYRRLNTYIPIFKSEIHDKKRINFYLWNAFKKYGIDNFEASILEYCEIEKLKELELRYMILYKSTDRNFGYNLRLDSSTGMMCHELTKEKISARLRKEWSEGVRDGHSEKLKKSWESSIRRDEQRKMFSKILQKYEYKLSTLDNIFIESVDYSKLRELKLENCLSTFHTKKTTIIKFKGYIIEKVLLKI